MVELVSKFSTWSFIIFFNLETISAKNKRIYETSQILVMRSKSLAVLAKPGFFWFIFVLSQRNDNYTLKRFIINEKTFLEGVLGGHGLPYNIDHKYPSYSL